MWDEIVKFLVSQNSWAGLAILCLGGVVVLFYKENKEERALHQEERKESTDKFVTIATESVKYIAESTNALQTMQREMQQHTVDAQEHRRMSENSLEKILVLLDLELKNRGRG